MTERADHQGPPRRAVRATAPFADVLAGRRWFPLWAKIHHRGRRSGTEYTTPVAIVPTVSKQVFLIGLPWGPKTNWARNVIAAGGATLTWKGGEHRATEPRLIDGTEAAALAAPFFRPIVSRFPLAIVMHRD
jgi:deazaflavin-dependent oxidoreductase (nitroreductase family)